MATSKNQKINQIYKRQEDLLKLTGEIYDMVKTQNDTHVAALKEVASQLRLLQDDIDAWDQNIRGAGSFEDDQI